MNSNVSGILLWPREPFFVRGEENAELMRRWQSRSAPLLP